MYIYIKFLVLIQEIKKYVLFFLSEASHWGDGKIIIFFFLSIPDDFFLQPILLLLEIRPSNINFNISILIKVYIYCQGDSFFYYYRRDLHTYYLFVLIKYIKKKKKNLYISENIHRDKQLLNLVKVLFSFMKMKCNCILLISGGYKLH